ncbi:DUF4189 domain-containing protein [Xanthomonas floridensis]|uniref:DUF4189 domain-containing protein n=2 Tax=Xanthomonas floridensis TaxID=1843580 RepID=UPI0009EDFA41
MKMKLLPLVVLFLLMASNVYAEGQCPPGYYPIGGQGAAGCAPISGGGSSPGLPQATGEWEKRWGAFAIDAAVGVLGASARNKSKSDAKRAALQDCLGLGGKTCKVNFVYYNQCAAVARSLDGGGSTIQGAKSVEEAKKLALEACESKSKIKSCELVYTECSMSEFRRY